MDGRRKFNTANDFPLPASNFPTENNEEAKKIRIKRKSDHTNQRFEKHFESFVDFGKSV
ncbi:MAG: hypothetical protein ACK4E6_09810 [Chryseobacterium hispalense]